MAIRLRNHGKRCASLIPGLPDEVSLLCAARLPLSCRHNVSVACQRWRNTFQEKAFWDVRDQLSLHEEVLVLWTTNLTSNWYEWYMLYLSAKTWFKLPTMPSDDRVQDFRFSRLATFDKKLFIIGGRRRQVEHAAGDTPVYTLSSTVSFFDMRVCKWNMTGPLNVARLRCTTAVIHNQLYVCGGYTSPSSYTYSVEVYDVIIQKWRLVAEMNPPTKAICSVVMEGKLYVTAGMIRDTGHTGMEGIVYDPGNDKWTDLEDGINCTWCHQVVELNEIWYVKTEKCFDGRSSQSAIFVYDPRKESWKDLIRSQRTPDEDQKRIFHRWSKKEDSESSYSMVKLVAAWGRLCTVHKYTYSNGFKFEIKDLTGRILISKLFPHDLVEKLEGFGPRRVGFVNCVVVTV